MGIPRLLGDHLLLPVFRRVAVLRHAAAFAHDALGPNGYGALERHFIENGDRSRWTRAARTEIVRRFDRIHEAVEIHSNRADALIMAEALLSMTAPGAMVECGCFAGGSTAKLSVLAKLLGRDLLVFDSFEGLPDTEGNDREHYHSRYRRRFHWQAADCRAPLDRVRDNVSRYGELSVCTFIQGAFSDTMTSEHLPPEVGFACTDVVLARSTRDAFRAVWPRMGDGAIYFSRDAGFTKVLQTLFDEELWRELQDFPPVFFGAGYGMRDVAPNLGLMVKGRSLSAEHIHGLMIEKPM